MSLFKKTESYLGIDFGAGGMKLVEFHKTKSRPQLWTYGILDQTLDIHVEEPTAPTEIPVSRDVRGAPSEQDIQKKMKAAAATEPVDPRIDAYAGLLRHLVEKSRVTTKQVTASLPVSHVFHAVVTLPEVPAKEVDFHARAKVAKILPRPIEEMQVVHQILPQSGEAGKDMKVLVTAAPKRLIRFYTDIFSKAGLTLEELETEAFAIERALVGRDLATIMMVDIGAERTNFLIIDQGLPVTQRSIQIGGHTIDRVLQDRLGVEPALVNQMKFDLSRSAGASIAPELFTAATEPIIKEIQYGFDLFLHQTGNENKRPEKIILTGGAALFPTFVSTIQAAFDIKVFVGDPWARVVYQQRLKPLLDAIGPRMGVAIGLALRKILPPEQKKRPVKA